MDDWGLKRKKKGNTENIEAHIIDLRQQYPYAGAGDMKGHLLTQRRVFASKWVHHEQRITFPD